MKFESSYEKLPMWGQTAALNAYGLRNRYRMRRWNRILAELSPTEWLSRDMQVALVAASLRRILEHALLYVPRYIGFQRLVEELRGPDAGVFDVLHALPVVTREEILADRSSFLSTAMRGSRLVWERTSGTTGTSFATRLEPSAVLTSDALWWRRTLWAGYRDGDWIARLVGDPAVPLSDTNPVRPFRLSRTDRRLYLSSYHLSRSSAPAMLREIERLKPAFIMGYPSALEGLARLADRPPRGLRLRAILYSSEPLHEHQRAVVQAFFDAPVRGLYGCAERVVSAAECDCGSYHLGLVDGYVEGEFGEVSGGRRGMLTGLLNRAMPLIRYDLGDDIEPQPAKTCACGRTLPIVADIVTKREDAVVTPSGRVISPSVLTWAFKDVSGLQRAQVVQRSDASIEVRVVAEADSLQLFAPSLERHVRRLVFGEVPVSVVPVQKLEMTTAGKTRFVVSEYSGRYPKAAESAVRGE